jgi:hypothetical protein
LLGAQKSLDISRITSGIQLDGLLNEDVWLKADVADSFVVFYPSVGTDSRFQTKVKMLYDDEAIYVGAEMIDQAPDSVMVALSARDDFGNADWFGVIIDPYGAGQNGFSFFVTAAGVEIDAIRGQVNADYTWNAVWKSNAQLTETGWSVEMKIPLTQLRFPKEKVQNWKVNFKREIRRYREVSYWNPVDPQVYGQLAQSGKLNKLEDLHSPLRLSISPYATGYLENYYDDQTNLQQWGFRQRFGMDMKLGLSEAFTLDATLVPDFGQTVSDNLVLNLSPFEVRYNENRPFFLEGMDLFGIGDVFYTRRIGDNAYYSAWRVDSLLTTGNTIVSAPAQAQLVNASKISGRTAKGTGIGVFNAIESRSSIIYEDSLGEQHALMAHPFSNYNVFVVSQNLKNNGSVSLINTNVLRPEAGVVANVSSGEFQLLNKKRTFSFFGQGKFSYNQAGDYSTNGYTGYFNAEKVKGNINYGIEAYRISSTYDPNELGYQERNNLQGAAFYGSFNNYAPKGGHLLRRTVSYSARLEYLVYPVKYQFFRTSTEWIGTYKNFLTCGFYVNSSPAGELDHFESRFFGIPVARPAWLDFGGWYSSNYSKRVALDFSLSATPYAERGMVDYNASVSPRFRVSNKLFIVPRAGVTRMFRNFGYVYVSDPSYLNSIILGTRDRWIVNNSVTANYTFTNRIAMSLKLNHYWQEVTYLKFSRLDNDGNRHDSGYTGLDVEGRSLHNTSFNAFTIDVNFKWVVYPGSQILFVWKYNIYASKQGNYGSYFNVFSDLFSQPQLNSFSIKALFFIDAGKWIKRK